jgi:hypothetical protein
LDEDEMEEASVRLEELALANIDPGSLLCVKQFAPEGIMQDNAVIAFWFAKSGRDVGKMERYVRSVTDRLK